jgi:hypothetical protein
MYSPLFLKAAAYADSAEIKHIEGNFASAELFYDSLFQLMPIPSGNDVWNRGITAIRNGNKTLQDSMVRMLFRKGYAVKDIAKCFDTKTLEPLITPDYQQKHQSIDEWRERLTKEDQRVNRNKKENPEEWVEVWLKNVVEIMEVTRKQHKVDSFYSLEISAPWISLIHFFQLWGNSISATGKQNFLEQNPHFKVTMDVDYESYGVIPFLVEQVESGNYHRGQLGVFLNLVKYRFSLPIIHQVDDLMFIAEPEFIRKGALDTINENRRILGLGTFDEHFRKARYTDSVLTAGKPFSPIPKDSLEIANSRVASSCALKLSSGRAPNMFMKNPAQAPSVIEKIRNRYLYSDPFVKPEVLP